MEQLAVAVIVERAQIEHPWQSEKWEVVGVVPDDGTPGAQPSVLYEDNQRKRWLHPGLRIGLHRDEAEGYYLNLTTPRPFVFIMWRLEDAMAVPKIVTLSYNEAARMMDGGEQVEGIPMPDEWRNWLGEYTARYYRPERKKARARPPSFQGARRDEQ